MGWFQRLFGGGETVPPSWSADYPAVRTAKGRVQGDDEFMFPVVGTSFHQEQIKALCGSRRSREGVHHYCHATLRPQPDNPYDVHAVVVMVEGFEAGHLERDAAKQFITALSDAGCNEASCAALIIGGWDRGGHDRGYFGVRLDACMPFQIG